MEWISLKYLTRKCVSANVAGARALIALPPALIDQNLFFPPTFK
jgi:hypothetical protein